MSRAIALKPALVNAGRCLFVLCVCLASNAQASSFDFAALVKAIEVNRAMKVDQALALLPLDLLSNYALVFNSRSLQGASFTNPRAILFGSDARLIISFNGDATQKGYDALEVMEYQDEGHQFVFREIEFPQGDAGEQRLRISEPNPHRCLFCHGAPPRPIWDTHPIWPGAYGERYLVPLGNSEAQGLKDFLGTRSSNSRYQYLRNVEVFGDPNTFAPNAKFLYSGTEVEPPNAHLSRLLAGLNAEAMIQDIVSSPRFHLLRYAALASLAKDCGDLSNYLPPSLALQVSAGFGEFVEETRRVNREQQQVKQLRVASNAYRGQDNAEVVEDLAATRYVAEALLGVNTREWTLALEKDTFDFTSPQSFAQELEVKLLGAIKQGDSDLQNMASYREVGQAHKYCKYLMKKSAESMIGWEGVNAQLSAAPNSTVPRIQSMAKSVPAMLHLCANCHQGEIAPALPFSNPQETALRLKQTGFARGSLLDEILYRLSAQAGQDRMPRGVNLTDDEVENLKQYFRSLAARTLP